MTNQDCIFEKEIQKSLDKKKKEEKKKSLFVISPFGYPYDELYTNYIQPAAIAAGFEPQRADRAYQLGFVMCTKICRLMQEADYVVADLTENNPNVYYELGMAWGFGKKVVLLRDTDVEPSKTFTEIFGETQPKVTSYKELIKLEKMGSTEKAEKLKKFLNKFLNKRCIKVEELYNIEMCRSQGAYIREKTICFCYRQQLPDAKFYLPKIKEAADCAVEDIANRKPEAWKVEEMPVTSATLCKSLPEKFLSAKIVMVDVTHYNHQEDTSIYFALGLSHALGRETIPITNRAKCRDSSPFDVRGLWQVYFVKLEELKVELYNILCVIEKTYQQERNEYPLRFIWDKVLEHPARLSVFTCARGAPRDADRIGGRTNVDKWDYQAVAKLALYLANQYKQATMEIRPSEDKVRKGLQTGPEKRDLAEKITKKIKDAPNSIMIIGSPDVSDYAEVVLSKIYNVKPYDREKCRRPDEFKDMCWDCPENIDCVGKRGYLFYKNTQTTKHPRAYSSFFRNPPKETKECVLWYKERFDCEDSMKGKVMKGETLGVLTIFKDRDDIFQPGTDNSRWIILLSGFTGVATYGLAELLTSLDVKTEKGQTLQDTLKENGINLEVNGVQVLLSIGYKSKNIEEDRDPREPSKSKITICNVQPLFPQCCQNDKCHDTGTTVEV